MTPGGASLDVQILTVWLLKECKCPTQGTVHLEFFIPFYNTVQSELSS